MKESFRWNPYADQPHNVAPRGKRFRRHLRFAPGYMSLAAANLRRAVPVLRRYRRLRDRMYRTPARLEDPFGMAVVPSRERAEAQLEGLGELGISRALFRIPSWEPERLTALAEFVDELSAKGIETTAALLQNREDVLDPPRWRGFLDETFERFGKRCTGFEIGHAWNRTKWGVWDYREYRSLAAAAFEAAEGRDVRLLGPAVIDFEFHLYPPLLGRLPFDTVTSLLYVDRMGAPENRQAGWDTSRKTALLRAVVDVCARPETALWVTEVNWPLKGTGRYSPAAGRPNVTEDEQADFLVRYYILALAGGFVERVYWWRLAAPGYGLIDDRDGGWRKRPGFQALAALVSRLRDSSFLDSRIDGGRHLFLFRRRDRMVVAGWHAGGSSEVVFPRDPFRVCDRSGRELPGTGRSVRLEEAPRYIEFSCSRDEAPSEYLPELTRK